MSVLDPYELEMQVLGLFARAALHGQDRRGAMVPLHPATGLPVSANDLVGRSRAVRGPQLALELRVVPRRLAAGILRRGLSRASPQQTKALASIPPDDWTGHERELVDALELQIKRFVHRRAECGWFRTQVDHEGDPQPLGSDGLTECFEITWDGLREALRRVRGTRFEQGPRWIRDDIDPDDWRSAPDWARSEAQ